MKTRFFKDNRSHSLFLSFMSFCLSYYCLFKKNHRFAAACFILLGLYARSLQHKKILAEEKSFNYALWKKTIGHEELPLAIVDLEAFDQNLATLSQIVKDSGKKIRLATKSLRIPALIKRALESSPSFQGLMCYSIREAAFLHQQGFDDFLIAYPSVQTSDLYLLGELVEANAKVTMAVDDLEQIQKIAKIMKKFSRPLPLVIDFDTSLHFAGIHLGVRRSPIRTLENLKQLLKDSLQYTSIKVIGVMAYEAIVAGLPDQNPYKILQNPVANLVRKYSVYHIAKIREQIPQVFKSLSIPLEIFNGGGTGSVNFAAKESALTEVTFGSGLLCPHIFDYYSNIQLKPASFFALETTRRSDPQYITCLGGGYVASGEPGVDRLPRPIMPHGLTLVATEGAGEVQTPLKVSGEHQLSLGDPIFFRHAKAGELAKHFNQVLLVTKDKSTYHVDTYRGMQQCFL